jgi:hypothetical protein
MACDIRLFQRLLRTLFAMDSDLGCDGAVPNLNLDGRLRAVKRDLGCDGSVSYLNLDGRLRAVERDLGRDGAVPDFDSDFARSHTADDLDFASDCCDERVHCWLPV